MADLNVNTQEGGPRILDFVYGAALGVSALLLSAGLLEVVNVAEFGQVDLYGPGNKVKITDTVTATLSTNISANPSESLKISDTVNAATYLATSGFDETLHAQEFGQVDLYGPGARIKITDTVTATVGTSIDANTSESLKIADTASTQTNILNASGFDEVLYLEDGVLYEELLHIQDSVTASLAVGPQAQELIHVQDSVTASFDAEQATAAESCKLSDAITVQMTLVQASVSESLRISDAVTTGRATARVLPLLYSSVTLRTVLWSTE